MMSKFYSSLKLSAITVAFGCLLINATYTEGQLIRVSVPDTTASTSDTLFLSVNILDSVTELEIYGGGFTLTFDDSVLLPDTVATVTAGPVAQGFTVVPNIEIPGEVTVALFSFSDPMSGSGVLAVIPFHIVGGPGDTTTVHFANMQLAEGTVPTAPEDGLFTVSTEGNTPPMLSTVPDTTIREGQLLEFTVEAQDADGDTLIFRARGLPEGAIFDSTETHLFSWEPDSTQAGIYDIEFLVDDGKGGRDSTAVTITVEDVSGVTISVPDTSITRGSVSIPVYVSDLTGLGVFSLRIVLSFSDSILVPTGVGLEGAVLSPEDSVTVNKIIPGKLVVVAAASTPLEGTGVLFFASFDVVGDPAESTVLHFDEALFNEGVPASLTTDGRVTIFGLGISGQITYYSNGNLIDDVTVALSGDYEDSALTDAEGIYGFSNLVPGTYKIKPITRTIVPFDPAVRAYDAALVLGHSAWLDTLDVTQQIAGDVTGNGAVTPYDASYILRYVVGIVESFPIGAHWAFSPQERNYPQLETDQHDQDFIGIRYGDVSGNWEGQTGKLVAGGIRRLRMGHPLTTSGDRITVPIEIDDATGVLSADVTLEYDLDRADLLSVSTTELSAGGLLAYRAKGKMIKIALARSVQMNNGGALVNLLFKLRPRSSEFGFRNSDLMVKSVVLNEGRIGTVVENIARPQGVSGTYALSQNMPNPFNPLTTIAYDLPEATDVTLTIYTITGQQVATVVSGHQEAGHYEVSWDGSGSANGVYLYRLKAGGFVKTRRMLLLK